MAKTPYNQNLVRSLIDNKNYIVFYDGAKACNAERDGFWFFRDFETNPAFVYWEDANFELINVWRKLI